MEKKEVVINTARELFTKYGYKKVSMDEIARTSNVCLLYTSDAADE